MNRSTAFALIAAAGSLPLGIVAADLASAEPRAAAEAATTFGSITPTLRSMRAEGDGLHDDAHLSIGVRLPPGVEPASLLTQLREFAGDAAQRYRL